MKGIVVSLIVLLTLLIEILLIKNPLLGLILYLVFMTSLYFIFSRNEKLLPLFKFVTLLLLIPLIRILQFFVSLPEYISDIVVYSILLLLTLYYLIWFKISPRTRRNWIFLPIIVIIGVIMGLLGKFFLNEMVFLPFSLILLISVSEELFFKSLLFETGKDVLKPFALILSLSLFYAVLHISFGFTAFAFFLLFSLISNMLYYSTRNVILSMILSSITYFIMTFSGLI